MGYSAEHSDTLATELSHHLMLAQMALRFLRRAAFGGCTGSGTSSFALGPSRAQSPTPHRRRGPILSDRLPPATCLFAEGESQPFRPKTGGQAPLNTGLISKDSQRTVILTNLT